MNDYLLSITTKEVTTERLVRAKNSQRAIIHVTDDIIGCAKASSDDIVRLTKAGVEIEQAE